MNTDILDLLGHSFAYFLVSYYFWITWIKDVSNFQVGKIQPQGVA